MATQEEKELLIKSLKFTPRTYKIVLWGYGCEIAVGKLNKGQYEYWSDQDEEDIIDFCIIPQTKKNWTISVPPDADFLLGGEWYDNNNWVDSIRGCYFEPQCTITVTDEKDKHHWSSQLGWGVQEDGIKIKHREISIDKCYPEVDYYYRFQAIEKGFFWDGDLELRQPFSPEKLEINTVNFEGVTIVDNVKYDNEILCSDDYDVRIKDYHCTINEAGKE